MAEDKKAVTAEKPAEKPAEPLEELKDVYCTLAKTGVMQYDQETKLLWIEDRVVKTPLTKFVADALVGGRLKQVDKAAHDAWVAKQKK